MPLNNALRSNTVKKVNVISTIEIPAAPRIEPEAFHERDPWQLNHTERKVKLINAFLRVKNVKKAVLSVVIKMKCGIRSNWSGGMMHLRECGIPWSAINWYFLIKFILPEFKREFPQPLPAYFYANFEATSIRAPALSSESLHQLHWRMLSTETNLFWSSLDLRPQLL